MKTFNDLAALKEAYLVTGTLVQIKNPTIVEGTVETSGYGVALPSSNVFIPRLDSLETLSARKCTLLDSGQVIAGFRKSNTGEWEGEVAGALTPTLHYGGQIWWPSKEAGDLPGDSTSEIYTVGANSTFAINNNTLTLTARRHRDNLNVTLTYDRNDSLKYAPSLDDGGGGTAIFGVVTAADSPLAAQDNRGYLCDTRDGAITINLPPGPTLNDYVAVGDYNGQVGNTPVTVATTDGAPIMGLDEDFTLDTNYAVLGFSYIDNVVGWKATAAVGESEAPQAIQTKDRFTGAPYVGDTTFTTTELYDVGFVDVFYNGVRLDSDEFTATDRRTIILSTPFALAEDILTIVSYNHLDLTNFYDMPDNPNLLINGGMRVSQRGASFPITTDAWQYTVDRWGVWDASGLTISDSNAANTNGAQMGIDAFISAVGTTAGTWKLQQPIEMSRSMGGNRVTVSWFTWGSTDLAGRDISVRFRYNYGVDGTLVEHTAQAKTIQTNNWVRNFLIFDLPEMDNSKAEHANDFIGLVFEFPKANGGSYFISNVKVEYGGLMTPYRHPLPGDELAACQRYYQVCSAGLNAGYYPSAHGISVRQLFPVPMRSTPSLLTISLGGTIKNDRALSNIGTTGAIINAGTHTSGEYGSWFWNYSADAEF